MKLENYISPDELINESERFVLEELNKNLDQLDPAVLNEDCLLDMATYAMNKVTPRYRANLLGRLFSAAQDEAFLQEVQQAVAEAIQVVSENPPI